MEKYNKKIYDCFIFYNELDLLDIRLNILNEVVDKFVIVEATKTFSGQTKPLYFSENKQRYEKFKDKIIHVIVEDFPIFDSPWKYEDFQRNAISRGLKDCKNEDIILISDLDEIPNPVSIIENIDAPGIKLFEQKMFYYYFNFINKNYPIWYFGTKMLSHGEFLHGLDNTDFPYSTSVPEESNQGTTANKIRYLRTNNIIKDAGWHFSYLGGEEFISNKIKSFSHQEYNSDEYASLDKIKERVEKGEDLFGREGFEYIGIPIDGTFPKYILENQDKFDKYIYKLTNNYIVKEFNKNIQNLLVEKSRLIDSVQNKDSYINSITEDIELKSCEVKTLKNILSGKDAIIENKESYINSLLNSTSWKITAIFRFSKNILLLIFSRIKKIIRRLVFSFIYFLKIYKIRKTLHIHKQDKKARIVIYNTYLPTLGGGEKETVFLCKFMEEFYNNKVEVFILAHNYGNLNVNNENYPKINDLEKVFNVKLNNTKIIKLDCFDIRHKSIINFIKTADIFVNLTFQSKDFGFAKKNIYRCMFPPKNNNADSFLSSYDYVVSNSKYTEYWLNKYWSGFNFSKKVIYPPVYYKKDIEGLYNEQIKKNVILNVGRFFVGGHSKKQDRLVDFFINNFESLKDYELHLVGAVSSNINDLKYLKEIKDKIRGYPIFIHISCSKEELDYLYSIAKIYWHATGYLEDKEKSPEKNEHFGITIVEAMSHGAVPVVYNNGGGPEIISPSFDGFLWETESECIGYTKKIIRDDTRIKFSQNAVAKSKLFTVENFNDGFSSILK